MRRSASAFALIAMTLAGGPALGAEALESVFQSSYRYAGEDRIYNEAVVPLLPDNACYNWYVRVAPESTLGTVAETLTLPVALSDWGELASNPDDGIDVAADGRSVTRNFTPELDADGWFSHSWCVVAGDPTGPHSIEISVAGETLASFDFQVVLPEDYAWPSISQPLPRERSVDHSW